MKLYQSSIFLLITILSISCRQENSEEIDQENIWTDYRVVVNHQINKQVARTTFKNESHTGETLRLGEKGSISANGTELIWSGIYNWYEQSINKETQVEFSFTDNDENLHYGTVTVDTTITYDENLGKNDSLTKSTIQFIPWANAAALLDGEVVNFVIIQNDVTQVVRTDSVNATGIYLSAASLNGFQLGDATVHFEKWKPGTMTNATSVGGYTLGHYISRSENVKIVSN